MLIDDIYDKIAADHFEFPKHAVDQTIVRMYSVQEVHEAGPVR